MKTMRVRFVVGEWLVIVAGLVLLPMWGQSQTSWLSATDGEWRDPARWTAGVPDGNRANLQRTDGSYTVWVTNGVEASFTRLHMNNNTSGANTTRLHIANGELRQEKGGGVIESSHGVQVFLGDGGVFSYAATNEVLNQYLDIKNGSTWTIDGGSLLLTNLFHTGSGRGQAWIGQASSAALYLKSGVADFRRGSGTVARETYVGRQNPGHTGVVEITGGTMYFSTPASRGHVLYLGRWAGAHGIVRILGGEVIIEGSTSISIGGVDDNSDHAGAYGKFIIGENAVLSSPDSEGTRLRAGGGNNATGHVYIAGMATNIGAMIIGACTDGRREGTASGTVVIDGGAVRAKTDGVIIGDGDKINGTLDTRGEGLLEIIDGSLRVDNYGFRVGRAHRGGVGHGHLVMHDGSLVSDGGWQQNTNTINQFSFGQVAGNNTSADSRALGRFDLFGGIVTNRVGLFLGANGGTGIVHQTGGVFDNTPASSGYRIVIGYNFGASAPLAGNGYGLYDLSGGEFKTAHAVHIGGLPADVTVGSWQGNLANQPGAIGRVQVTGGEFNVGGLLHVGGNGTGTVSLGAAGEVNAGSARLDTGASLEFVFGEDSVGQVVVDGELDVHANATLTIDLRGYNLALGGRFKLVSCDSRTADFDADNITILGGMATVDQSGTDIWVSIPSGTLILLR